MTVTANAPAELQCSGCKKTKLVELFPKYQRIEKPWEEISGQSHFRFDRLPSGAVVVHHIVVPKELKCAR